MRFVLGCVMSAVLGSFLTVWIFDPGARDVVVAQGPGRGNPALKIPQPAPRQPVAKDLEGLFNEDGLTDEERINVAVYERLHKSVVNITTESRRVDNFFFLEHVSEGTGSGSVIDREGHILTNWHVIRNARHIGVTLFNGESFEAKVIGFDPPNDIAIIKINDVPKEDLFPIRMGDSSKLKVGMRVLAIGNPFELERTLTTGIISSLNRSLQIQENWSIKSVIQIDAAINPGNSGGPLLDLHGRLIGINTAIAAAERGPQQSAGIGFAIPVNLVSRVVPELVTHGRVVRPEVGIQRVFETEDGLLVERLTPGGPAEQAGIQGPTLLRQRRGPFIFERLDRSTADLIIAVNGRAVKTVAEFRETIAQMKPGDEVKLTVVREGARRDVRLKLGGGPAPRAAPGVSL